MVSEVGNYDYFVNQHHPEIGADPTAINYVKITSITTITLEVGRGTKDNVVSMMTRNMEGVMVEDQDDETAVMSAARVVIRGNIK